MKNEKNFNKRRRVLTLSSRDFVLSIFIFFSEFKVTLKLAFTKMLEKYFAFLILLVVFINKDVKAQQCGVVKVGQGNIIGGEFITHGQFPW